MVANVGNRWTCGTTFIFIFWKIGGYFPKLILDQNHLFFQKDWLFLTDGNLVRCNSAKEHGNQNFDNFFCFLFVCFSFFFFFIFYEAAVSQTFKEKEYKLHTNCNFVLSRLLMETHSVIAHSNIILSIKSYRLIPFFSSILNFNIGSTYYPLPWWLFQKFLWC